MQAQEPIDPYVGAVDADRRLRSDGAEPRDRGARSAVRMGLLRGTLHLVTARDALAQYPILADVMARSWRSSPFAKRLVGVDIEAVVARARAALEERPMTPTELGAALAPRWPDRDPTSLAYAGPLPAAARPGPAARPVGPTGRPTNTTAEAWLGRADGRRAAASRTSCCDISRASGRRPSRDMRVWSWLTGLREVVERLRPQLARRSATRPVESCSTSRMAPIADPDLPAPIRFLPQYDNVFLSHDDRSRILVGGVKIEDLGWKGGVLVDGYVGAAWRIRREKRRPPR